MMVSFHEIAEQELYEAVSYYDSQSPGLGTSFLDEVERAISRISEHPKAYPLINGVVRRKLIHRFPYSIMYSSSTDEIRILAIANQKRRPFYWYGRK
jgi:plasmid stabilization system protein ParE